MKLAAIMSICDDQKYFDYAEYSIPSFCANNPEIELHIFTNDLKKCPEFTYPNLCYWDFNEIESRYTKEYENIDKMIHRHMRELKNYWDGKTHTHKYVAHLFVMAQRLLTHATHILMIDSDTYFHGNLLPYFEKWIAPAYDFYQVERTDDIHKILRGPDGPEPGAGCVIWKREGPFIEAFKKHFLWDDQRTFNYVLKDKLERCLIRDQNMHVVYPAWKCKRKGIKFTKEYLDGYLNGRPAYFHLGECAVEQKQQQLMKWYPYKKN